MPSLPEVSFTKINAVLPSAFTIAFLAGIEALLSAVVADGMAGTRHRSNQELIGQGVANLSSAFFGGLPATGAIARNATNLRSGAKTPVAGIMHAVFRTEERRVGKEDGSTVSYRWWHAHFKKNTRKPSQQI